VINDEWLPGAADETSRRPLAMLGNALTVLLGLFAVLAAAALVLRGPTPYFATRARDLAEFVAVVIAIGFVVWFRRARINAEDSDWRQRRSLGWAVWGWVIPIGNLWIPFQLMGDIWRASLPESEQDKTAWLPGLWWTFWLLGGLTLGPKPPYGAGVTVGFLGFAPFGLTCAAIAGLLLIPIIRRIDMGLPAPADLGRRMLFQGSWLSPGSRRLLSISAVPVVIALLLGGRYWPSSPRPADPPALTGMQMYETTEAVDGGTVLYAWWQNNTGPGSVTIDGWYAQFDGNDCWWFICHHSRLMRPSFHLGLWVNGRMTFSSSSAQSFSDTSLWQTPVMTLHDTVSQSATIDFDLQVEGDRTARQVVPAAHVWYVLQQHFAGTPYPLTDLGKPPPAQ
jgi:hypothetical protein